MEIPEGLTFDDVLLVPSYSQVLPKDVDVSVQLTPNIRLNIPILSAAMDTVTEARTAISMAREGGLGVIHRNMPIERQALEVEKVKKSESGMIIEPVTVEPEQKIADVLQLMQEYRISGVPVVKGKKLVGIVTNRDLRFETNLERSVAEVMTRENLITVSPGISLEKAKEILHEHRIEKLLVVDEKGNLCGLITIKDIMKLKKYPNACKDELGRLRVGAAIGVGADWIAGVGVPQITAIMKASNAGRRHNVPIVADGGVKFSGDITKAIAAGANAVMIGSLFAGTEESPGETILYQGRTYKLYRGMGSIGALKEGLSDRYMQNLEIKAKYPFEGREITEKFVPEGIEGRVPYRGPLAGIVYQLIGGLRAGMGYLGCRNIEELQTNARFIKITLAGLRESHVHDVIIVKEKRPMLMAIVYNFLGNARTNAR